MKEVFYKTCLCALWLVAASVLPAHAGDTPAAPPPLRQLTWPQVMRLLDAEPRVLEALLKVRAARGSLSDARAVPNPTLQTTAAYGQARAGGASRFEWGFGLSVPLGWIAQRGSRVDAAQAQIDTAGAEASATRAAVLIELRTMFLNAVHRQMRVEALQALADQMAQLLRTVHARVDHGEARPVEATRVEVETGVLESELDAARLEYRAHVEQLGLLLGLSVGQPLELQADLTRVPEDQDIQALRTRGQDVSPLVEAAKARVRVRAAQAQAEHRARWPGFSIEAFADSELDRLAYGVGLALDLPVWNWNTGRIDQAQARLEAAQRGLEAAERQVASALAELDGACRGGARIARRYQQEILPRSESAAATVERTYQLGETPLLEVIDARRTLLETKKMYLDALVRAQIDCSRLRAAAGEEMP